ncbi:MAG: formylglycine-generating enzyme family protein, partial [Geminicoccaceae bacterium]
GGAAQALRLEPSRVSVAARLPAIGRLIVETDRDRLELDRLTKPAWASGLGRDRFGLFADLMLPGHKDVEVKQRMRWCPPGSFVMGSPVDEAGRYDAEGPQHGVLIGSGFWLFDTPCTQALWEVVMGSNRGRFQSPTRPVEQVSFEEVQDFMARLNERVPGLDLVLPSEAQWEYACRAGTTTATYAGEMRLLGENNAPVLDEIAWYGGNSGVGYELDDGQDSSDWPEKQYPHKRAGTRPVGQKRPNGWGLHDMLGNVWEWCADHWHASYDGAPSNGSAWLDKDVEGAAVRVVRGGSWGSDARFVRAAYRFRYGPSNRFADLGFRCARVQGVSQTGEQERRAGAGDLAERSELDAGAGTPRRRAAVSGRKNR